MRQGVAQPGNRHTQGDGATSCRSERAGRARGAAALLRQEGWDTAVVGIEAYSTLGWFDDPLLSSMLRRSDAELAALAGAGCIAFSPVQPALPNTAVLLRALQYAATFGYTVRLQPQDRALVQGGVAHDGQVATRLGLPGIPVCAETVAIASETDTGPCQGGPWNGSERRARMACGHWLRWTALGPDPDTP